MDLLIEKLDGSRYYLSQYKVLITDFDESSPTVTRNSKQLDQRNGNIDFGGWHTDKTINVTGYYRADDMDEEESLREKLYALLSDPNGYYITQLKTTPDTAVERPGETSGNYYDKLTDYPSHKRFLVYTEAPEMELVGNVGGTLLYKLTAEFKTIKLPYGETPAIDIDIDNTPYKDVPMNLISMANTTAGYINGSDGTVYVADSTKLERVTDFIEVEPNQTYWMQDEVDLLVGQSLWFGVGVYDGDKTFITRLSAMGSPFTSDGTDFRKSKMVMPDNAKYVRASFRTYGNARVKLEKGSVASPWSPNPADPEYNYSLTGNVSIPYSGTVPCNQLEQGFSVELTARSSASSLSLKIDDTEFTYSGAVASGDVFLFTGFSYTKNGLSIVSKTNKAYFILQPDKPNRITCNVPGTVRIIGFQNLYA